MNEAMKLLHFDLMASAKVSIFDLKVSNFEISELIK